MKPRLSPMESAIHPLRRNKPNKSLHRVATRRRGRAISMPANRSTKGLCSTEMVL